MQIDLNRNNNTIIKQKKVGIYQRVFKRPIDLTLALIAMIILMPVLLLVGLMVRMKLGTPVIFRQNRPGLNEKIFTMYKFRTMTDERDEKGNLLPDNIRLTKFGEFLRNASLDELPELWNIIKGDMSIIGPRPLLVKYLPLYNNNQKHRHDVRPGLSGLAQVCGRNSITWEEKFDLDIKYVNSVSFLNDFKILILTACTVIKKNDVNYSDNDTMPNFKGSNSTKRQEVYNENKL